MRAPTLFFVLLNMRVAVACSCIDIGLAGNFAGADVVFEAISLGARRVEPKDSMRRMDQRVTMRITTVYKGSMRKGTIHVFTSSSFASCGAWLPFGGRYLVFASTSADGLPVLQKTASAYTGMCHGNKFYPFWRFGLRKNVRRLVRGEEIPARSRWSRSPSW